MNINETIAKHKGIKARTICLTSYPPKYINDEPDYEHDPRLYMALLDEIKKTGFEFRLESDTTGSGEGIYTAVILEQRNDTNGTGWGLRVISTQSSIGTAICMAYIKMKGLEEG